MVPYKVAALLPFICLLLVSVTTADVLMEITDYSDSFTTTANGGLAGRIAGSPGPAPCPVENPGATSPAPNWTPYADGTIFTFHDTTLLPSVSTQGNAGAATGFIRPEQGNGSVYLSDYGLSYGLREDYVVSIDAVFPATDRVNICSLANLGDDITSAGAMSVFFRADYSSSTHAGLDIYADGLAYEILATDALGITDQNWHNLAVRFDQPGKKIWIYVDGTLTGMGGAAEPVDLMHDYVGTELAGAPLATFVYSNKVVAVGAAQSFPSDSAYLDNFMVGSPIPEPSTFILIIMALAGLTLFARNRSRE
ncbi:MAG: PEP-CTERM sorting domain-containing protein [Pirellulales bacterium]|nr:PEP-CTERM sorting domain-containing protein [Pirellulales bacterium]